MTLRELVKEYRQIHGLSQRQFAAACGLSNGYISMLENNLNPKTKLPLTPSLPALKKISGGMGISLESLFQQVEDILVDFSATDISDDPKHYDSFNVVRIASRDGSYTERRLTDEQVDILRAIIDQFADAGEDL